MKRGRLNQGRLLWSVIRGAGLHVYVTGLLAYIGIMSLILLWIEPQISTYGDALWYCYATATTVGFGDIAATTPIGRILTIVLSLQALVAISLVTGVVVNFYTEKMQMKQDASVAQFMHQLEHLEDLSTEELRALSQQVRKRRQEKEVGR